jgi:hypothetical protein
MAALDWLPTLPMPTKTQTMQKTSKTKAPPMPASDSLLPKLDLR